MAESNIEKVSKVIIDNFCFEFELDCDFVIENLAPLCMSLMWILVKDNKRKIVIYNDGNGHHIGSDLLRLCIKHKEEIKNDIKDLVKNMTILKKGGIL